jgi:siroheme synthase
LFTTFSRGETGSWLNWAAVTPETTIAIYMPGTHYGEVADRLVENGLSPETPCVVVSQATRAEQKVRWTNIAALSSEAQLPAPSILLVGRVATQSVAEWGAGINPELLKNSEVNDVKLSAQKKN